MSHIISHSQRYLPHTLDTRYYACCLYRRGWSIREVCRRYKISKASLMRWNKRFDGSRASLADRSHRPLTPHPNRHTEEECRWIKNLIRRCPQISLCELYGKLKRNKGYSRHPNSLFRLLRKWGFYAQPEKKKARYQPQPYDTPTRIGEKWQMDVKYIPRECNVSSYRHERLYQYTVIDEASRERFLYPYKEISSYSTCDFLQRAIAYFGYAPKILQTDNGAEFTHLAKTNRSHPLDLLCARLQIDHQRIRPRTPRHNGKVERSHRSDNERFYRHLRFYSFEDLLVQMKRYLRKSNQIPMRTLGYLSPKEYRHMLEQNDV